MTEELIHKRMNDINTFQAHENEVYLRGTDEYGKDFQICLVYHDARKIQPRNKFIMISQPVHS